MQKVYFLGAASLLLVGCGRLDSILVEPQMHPDQWCTTRPCVELGGIVLDQALGSLLVYLLAGLFLVAGLRLWRQRGTQRSRWWWAWSLALGGLAAASAGTSYQAFGYELKCAGRDACTWTSWFEVVYMVLQNVSVDCMVVAVAHSTTRHRLRRILIWYAGFNALAHVVVTVYGVLSGNSFLLSFELLLLFSSPAFVVALGLNGVRYYRDRQTLDAVLLGAWAWLFVTNAAYFGYLVAGCTETFWRHGAGFYFSENDVLHVGMIGWILYLHYVVVPHIRDRTAES